MRLFVSAMLLLIGAAGSSDAWACDVCGCAVSNQTLGLLPQFSTHFVGLQYQYASSESKHPSLFKGKADEQSFQTYRTAQIWGRYQVSKKIQLFGFLPYINNTNRETAQTTRSEGIGDATLMANLSISLKENKKWKRLLLAGAGIKLPTGTYTGMANAERNGVPNVQTGSGSWDVPINVNYTQKATRWGFNADLSYLLTTANKEQYKFGNRMNCAVSGFYWIEKKSVKIVPQAGIRAEYALHDYDNFAKKWLNEKTGGTLLFSTFSTQVFYKKLGIKAAVQLPVYQQFAAGYVHSRSRVEGGIFILF